MSSGLEDFSLFELFRMEAEEQVRVLQAELLTLESGAGTASSLEALMRAAHSLKGAARIVGLDIIVHLTHAIEDRFVAAQQGHDLNSGEIDRMLTAVDWLAKIQALSETESGPWLSENTPAIEHLTAALSASAVEPAADAPQPAITEPGHPVISPAPNPEPAVSTAAHSEPIEDDFLTSLNPQEERRERTVRIAAERFDQILSLASETLVSSRNLTSRGEQLERNHRALTAALAQLEDTSATAETRAAALREIDRQAAAFNAALIDLDLLSRANEHTAERIYRNVLAGRLRPFSDGITGISRLVRDTARDLGKHVRLEVLGESTRVDRDILERLESPISHLVTNAIDHGIESPEERLLAGKPAEATLRLHARHENGRLVVSLRDDGRGIDPARIGERAIRRGLLAERTAATLSSHELFEFIFLPGFSTRDEVSNVSGRGVGLNVVQSMVQEAGGSVTISSEVGAGTVFRLTLPVTRSVVKVIRVQVEGEFYAIPLVRIDRVIQLEPYIDPADSTSKIEYEGESLPVFPLSNLLGLSILPPPSGAIPLLISNRIAFAVDRLVDEIELPVRRLDARLGKIPGVSAASLDENGLPLLILDMEDLVQTARGGPSAHAGETAARSTAPHILIVDDSHTVREIERRILTRAGYTVTAAQNGAEAWNLLRLNHYDLLVSDVDMPQMNGIELVSRVRDNPRLSRMPVIILSYKDREEDRRRGLEAGADYYLTKGDFQSDAFRQAIVDLIGTAEQNV